MTPSLDEESPARRAPQGNPQDQAEWLERLRTADTVRIRMLASDMRFFLDEDAARLARERLEVAASTQDERAATAWIELVARRDAPEARRLLVDAVRDRRLPLRPHVPSSLLDLIAAEVPDLGAAARARVEQQIQTGDTFGVSEWLRLLGRHGQAAEIDWLATMARTRGGSAAVEGLTRRPNALASQRVRELALEGHIHVNSLATLAETAPEVAFELVSHMLVTEKFQRAVEADRSSWMSALAAATRETTVPRTRELLHALTDPRLRVAACIAVQRLKERDLDASGFDDLLIEPARALEVATAGTSPADLSTLAAYIRSSPVTWGPRTVAALRQAASVVADESTRRFLVDTAVTASASTPQER
jgi:hypothetical protein